MQHAKVAGLIVLVLCVVATVRANPGVAGSCAFPSSSAMSPSQAGTGGFLVQVFTTGNETELATTYTAGGVYLVEISNSIAYRGFLLQAVNSSTPNVGVVGTFSDLPADLQHKTACNGDAVCHTLARRNAPRESDTVTWTAPLENSGTITFLLVGVVDKLNWFGQTDRISTSLTFQDDGSSTTGDGASTTGDGGSTTGDGASTTGEVSTTAAIATTGAAAESSSISITYSIGLLIVSIANLLMA